MNRGEPLEERIEKYPESRVNMYRFIKRKNAKDYAIAKSTQGKRRRLQW